MPKAYKYKGLLAKPKPASWALQAAKRSPGDTTLRIKATSELDTEYEALCEALFKGCGVPWPPWEHPHGFGWIKVAMTLAHRHVPAFGPKSPLKRRGRTPKGLEDDLDVALDMKATMARGLSARSAARHVARKRMKGETPAAIESRYRRVKKLAPIFRTILELLRQK